MTNIPEDPSEDQEPTVLERLQAAFPGIGEPKHRRFHPRWITEWNLDLADRMMRGEFISREEVDALALAMGQKPLDPEEARRIVEEVFPEGLPATLIKFQHRDN